MIKKFTLKNMIILCIALLTDVQIVARTLHAEAGGEPVIGIIAVGGVIGNRAVIKNASPKKICLARKQFSCWNQGILKRPKATKKYLLCIVIARKVVKGEIRNHFTHYYAHKKCKPKWAKDLKNVTVIGDHTFGTI